MSSVIRLARVVGDPEWHVFPGATICGAAEALAANEDQAELHVEVADNEDTGTTWHLTVVRAIGYEVRGSRGGE